MDKGKRFARTMKAGMSYRKSPGFVTNLDTLVTEKEGRAQGPEEFRVNLKNYFFKVSP